MHHDGPFAGRTLPAEENISGTNVKANVEDAWLDQFGCAFIAASRWLAGRPPFCGKPVRPGSPYCPRHDAFCRGQRRAPAL
jgi:hypothetical protein